MRACGLAFEDFYLTMQINPSTIINAKRVAAIVSQITPHDLPKAFEVLLAQKMRRHFATFDDVNLEKLRKFSHVDRQFELLCEKIANVQKSNFSIVQALAACSSCACPLVVISPQARAAITPFVQMYYRGKIDEDGRKLAFLLFDLEDIQAQLFAESFLHAQAVFTANTAEEASAAFIETRIAAKNALQNKLWRYGDGKTGDIFAGIACLLQPALKAHLVPTDFDMPFWAQIPFLVFS